MTAFANIAHVRHGYTILNHSPSLSSTQLDAIYRLALPAANRQLVNYVGAQAIKWFPVEDSDIAITLSTVVSDTTKGGTRVSYESSIIVMKANEAIETLQRKKDKLAEVFNKSLSGPSRSSNNAILIPRNARLKIWAQLLLGLKVTIHYPYRNPGQWHLVEAMVLEFAAGLPTRWLRRMSFATFTLSKDDLVDFSVIPFVSIPNNEDLLT